MPKNLDTPRTFPKLTGKAEWEARRARIRRQILVSCGLYPLPPKTPLRPRIFDRVVRDGYTIEKAYIQTYPGFYLAGNLYRPYPEKSGSDAAARHPGILVTHGHWQVGRMADTDAGSIPARAITFARMGCVAFTYDMVGYNDTRQIPDHYGTLWAGDRPHWLWSVSLMGLQTWNSVRALDFISSLPDVDKDRLAITGESGGGTQTMMLGAIDDRLAAVGPCVMVSHSMQGGCLCENSPGLRIDYSNMEIAACAGPKNQIMVGATGDWTKTMMTIEGPSVQSAYDLMGVRDRLKYVIFPYNHNINKTSRESVYRFFAKVLLHEPDADSFTEPPYKMEPAADLRVFPDDKPMPKDAKTADQLTSFLKEQGEDRLLKAKPTDKESLKAFQKLYRPLWEQILDLFPSGSISPMVVDLPNRPNSPSDRMLLLPRESGGPDVPLRLLNPSPGSPKRVVVLVQPKGSAGFLDANGAPGPLVKSLLQKGVAVALPELFLQPGRADAAISEARKKAMDKFNAYFTTYNRTDTQERVQDIATVCTYLRGTGASSITLVGLNESGMLAMLAAPLADRVAADCSRMDLTNDDALLTDDNFVAGLRRMGDFRTALTLAAPHPTLLFNTGAKFPAADWARDVYTGVEEASSLKTEIGGITDADLVDWAAGK
jgi:dienelactone hydrolase